MTVSRAGGGEGLAVKEIGARYKTEELVTLFPEERGRGRGRYRKRRVRNWGFGGKVIQAPERVSRGKGECFLVKEQMTWRKFGKELRSSMAKPKKKTPMKGEEKGAILP